MGRLEAAYAGALLALAESPDEADAFGEALGFYAEAYTGSARLRSFLLNPVLPRQAQKDALMALAAPHTPEKALHCLCLLVDRGRVAQLPAVAEEYGRLRAALADTLVIGVCAAEPLSEGEIKRLCAHFSAKYGAARAVVEQTVDPTLIGGVRVRIGDMLVDQSLFGRLEGLRRAIGEQLERK